MGSTWYWSKGRLHVALFIPVGSQRWLAAFEEREVGIEPSHTNHTE